MTTGKVDVGAVGDFADDSMTPVEIDGHEVLVVYQGVSSMLLRIAAPTTTVSCMAGSCSRARSSASATGPNSTSRPDGPHCPRWKKIRLYQTEIEDDRVFVVYQES